MSRLNYSRPQFRKSGGAIAEGTKFGGKSASQKQKRQYVSHVYMAAKHDGICKHCNKAFKKGNSIAWFANSRVTMHRKCV